MTLPASGAISLANNSGDTTTQSVNKELGKASPYNQTISINDAAVRTLGGFGGSGTVADMNTLHGKSAVSQTTLTLTYTSANNNTATNKNINIKTAIGGSYVAGHTTVNLTVSSGAILGSTSTSTYTLDTGTGWVSGDIINIINNGYIIGKGGRGGTGGSVGWWGESGYSGGPSINLQFAVNIDNTNGYIYSGGGGGGGGGGGTPTTTSAYGGDGGGGVGKDPGLGYIYGGITFAQNGGAGSIGHRNGGSGGQGGNHGASGYSGSDGAVGVGGAKGGHGLAIQRNTNTINGQSGSWTWAGNTRVYGGIS
jgi:hypothetical protein